MQRMRDVRFFHRIIAREDSILYLLCQTHLHDRAGRDAGSRSTLVDTGQLQLTQAPMGAPKCTRIVYVVALPPDTPERWAMIEEAQRDADALRRAHEHFVEIYHEPVIRMLRVMGARRQDAPDLAAEFLGLVLPARLIPAASRDRGSFNGLLVRSLRRFYLDHRRNARRRAALHDRFVGEVRASAHARSNWSTGAVGRFEAPSGPAEATEAGNVMTAALRASQRHFIAAGMRAHWRAFALAVLVPACVGAARPSLRVVGALISPPPRPPLEPQRVAAMVRTVRDDLRRRLEPHPDASGVVIRWDGRLIPEPATDRPSSRRSTPVEVQP